MRDRRPAAAAALLLLLTGAAYAPALSAGFLWDDDAYVTDNETLRSLDGLRRIWLEPRSIPQYYPLVHTTFWLEVRLWGLHPAGFHAVNLMLHALAALLLWRLLARLGVPGAWFGAALFAVHPMMVESVAWVTERKNVLSLPLALGAALQYLRFDEARAAGRRARGAYLAALALFVAALLSKTVVCTLPAVLLVIAWWKRGRIRTGDVAPLLPWFVLGLALGLATVWLEREHVGARGAEWSLSPFERVILAGRVIWFYAASLAWPHPLLFFYPRWEIDAGQLRQLLAPAGVAVVLLALWALRGRLGRGPLAAVLIFAGVLTPALGFFDVYPFRFSYVADHFAYHASAALLALAAAAGATALARLPAARRGLAAGAAGAAVLATLSALTFRQARIYHGPEPLYRHTLAYNPEAWLAYVNLAEHLWATGRVAEAEAVAREGVRRRGDVAEVNVAMAGALLAWGHGGTISRARLEEAAGFLRVALALRPDHTENHYNLANVLALLGRHDDALLHFDRAAAGEPDDLEAWLGAGSTLLALGRPAEARARFEAALALSPDDARARAGLARARAAEAAASAP